METKPLVIRVEDIASRQAWQYVFDSGPVWLGCGAEASLVIVRPFISLQHGCFRFDHHSVHYQDLDPGVGTIVDGSPAGNREVLLTEWTQLEPGVAHPLSDGDRLLLGWTVITFEQPQD